jgi:DedD protein
MATTASPEASEIRRRGRQRLIGAVAIVLLLVVFIPMLLDSEPRPPRNEPSLVIPSKENAPPLPPPGAAKPGEGLPASTARLGDAPASLKPADIPPVPAASGPESPKTPEIPPPAAPKPADKPIAAAAQEPPQAPGITPAEARPAAADAPRLEGFAVQVGAFRDEDKLRQARDKLGAAGIAHYTERLDAPAGPLTRLRAGPFPTREVAEAAVVRLRGRSLQGQVVALP